MFGYLGLVDSCGLRFRNSDMGDGEVCEIRGTVAFVALSP